MKPDGPASGKGIMDIILEPLLSGGFVLLVLTAPLIIDALRKK